MSLGNIFKTTLSDPWIKDYLSDSVNRRITKTDNPDIILVGNKDIENASRKRDLALSFINVEEAEIIEQNNDLVKLTVNLNDYEWTREKTINILFQRLAHVRIIIQNDAGEKFEISKYRLQVIEKAMRIPIYRPPPEFIIYLSDLDPQIIRQFLSFEEETTGFILVESVSRLFRKCFPFYFNESIAELLRVRLEK